MRKQEYPLLYTARKISKIENSKQKTNRKGKYVKATDNVGGEEHPQQDTTTGQASICRGGVMAAN